MYERYLNHQRDKAEFITYVFHDLLRVHFRVQTSSAFARSRYGAGNVPTVLANQRRLKKSQKKAEKKAQNKFEKKQPKKKEKTSSSKRNERT